MSWLRELKVGDEVLVVHWPTGSEVATVERCTAYSVWVNGKRFGRMHGFVAGENPTISDRLERLSPATAPRE